MTHWRNASHEFLSQIELDCGRIEAHAPCGLTCGDELRQLIKQTPVDELEIKEYPFVNFRINANTWVEVLLIYLVNPKKASAIRTTLIRKSLAALNKEPDKVMFPKGDNR